MSQCTRKHFLTEPSRRFGLQLKIFPIIVKTLWWKEDVESQSTRSHRIDWPVYSSVFMVVKLAVVCYCACLIEPV